MVTHLAAQITAKSAPKIAKCAFPKRETYNSSNLLLYKKDKKDNDHAKKYKVWFLNSQSMVFKIETYKSSKLLLYKREKKTNVESMCFENTKYVFLKLKVWFFASPLNGLVVFFSRLDMKKFWEYTLPPPQKHMVPLDFFQDSKDLFSKN